MQTPPLTDAWSGGTKVLGLEPVTGFGWVNFDRIAVFREGLSLGPVTAESLTDLFVVATRFDKCDASMPAARALTGSSTIPLA